MRRPIGITLALALTLISPIHTAAFAANDPDPVATAQVDTDSDGIINNEDSDIDGDGVANAYDDDIDGDGIKDFDDADPAGTNGDGGSKPQKVQQPLIPAEIDSPILRVAVATGLAVLGAAAWLAARRLNRKRKKSQHF